MKNKSYYWCFSSVIMLVVAIVVAVVLINKNATKPGKDVF